MEFKTIIQEGINKLYPNLNSNDSNYLNKRIYKIIELLYYQYNLNSKDFEHQLIQNDYKDIKWLLTVLLPYINVDNSELKSFNQLYTEKINHVDINKNEPIYKFTNLQYGRCIRNTDSDKNTNKIICEEIKFSYEHLDHNYYLFLQSLIISSNKLYVNWQNIIPIPESQIIKEKTYTNTLNLFTNSKLKNINIFEFTDNDFNDEQKQLLGSLYVGDIYNTIRNYLFEEIKEIKLLIFDVVVFPIREKFTAISILNQIFEQENLLNECLNNLEWDGLSTQKQNKFTEIWNNIIYIHSTGNEYVVKKYNMTIEQSNTHIPVYNISKISMERLLRGILVNFDRKFGSKPNIISSGYISIRRSEEEIEELEMLDEENINEFKFDNLYSSLKSIKSEYIYEFFREILQDFKKTYYSKKLLNIDKKTFKEPEIYLNNLTFKNFYNFAKSLSSYENNGKYIQFNKNWQSLEDFEKKIILDRLNNNIKKIDSWFNIKGYLKSLLEAGFSTGNIDKVDKINTDIYIAIRKNLIYIIFEALISKGILSKFLPDKTVTDQKYISGKQINELLKDKYFYKNEFNPYATESYYYLTELPYIESGQFLDILSKDSWYTMQAMEWVSQLGFCHHFINNRVSYVTGATGVGKSTHVPKLYLYYLKGIDYLSVGKVVCTQPRKTPTEKNAGEVSKQLGLPIFELDDTNNPILDNGRKIVIENYSVQMQHQGRKHIKNINQLILKFITDGTLVMEFKNILPVFKKQKSNINPTKMNLYDVVIVDEAHEHNKNMDILLTLLKIYSYYNPSLRIVILSATMDEDEPVYRRFYRIINDNQKYPLSTFIRNNNLDRINVDRRFHISAPGTGTRFTVIEEYKENYDIEVLINELVKTRKGDILVFQPGEADIIKLIENLNKNLPDNWIALPFYSTMNDERRNFIEDIDFKFSTLKMNRLDNFNTIHSIEEGKHTYTNFILVSTNIAEASITIKRLYYVIDTGIRKINYYDYKKRTNKLQTRYISETSRVQRKGRVGRTGPGEAFFMYKKGITIENKTPAELSILNISNDIFNRMRNNPTETKFNIEPHYKVLKDMYETRNGKYNYLGNQNHNDYNFIEYLPEYYETGFKLDDLVDNEGRFYIVHPDELNIKRNIYGTIVGTHNTSEVVFNKEKIESFKINSFIEDFEINNYVENITSDNIIKTELGINIFEIVDKFKFDNTDLGKLLIYSILNSCEDKVINLVTLLNILRNGDILNLFTVNLNTDTPNLQTIIGSKEYANCTSEYEILIKILDNLYNTFENTNLKNLNDLGRIIENQKLYYDVIKINNSSYNTQNIINIYKNFLDDEYKDRETLIDFFIKSLENLINDDLNINDTLNKFCVMNNYDIKVLKKYFTENMKLKDTLKSLYFSDKKNKSYKDFIEKYKKIFKEKYIDYDPLKLSVIMTYPYNIVYSIISTNSLISCYMPVTNNIYNIDKIKIFSNNKKQYINKVFIDIKYTKGISIYQNYNPDTDTVQNITHIEPKYLKLYKSIYNNDRIKIILQKYIDKMDKFVNQKYEDRIIKSKKIGFPLPKDYTIISNVNQTYNQYFNILNSL